MSESETGFRSYNGGSTNAGLIQDALNTAMAYQRHMARSLFESACLDGLERLAVDGSLPASFLEYFHKVMKMFDESTKVALGQLRDAGFKVQCRIECPYCCHQMPTGLTTAELVYLYHGMQLTGVASKFFRRCLEAEELWVEVFHQKINENNHPVDSPTLVGLISKSYRDLEHPCPFLGSGICQIYPYRPLACRMHFSLTPPHWCRPTHFQNDHALGFNLEPGKCVFDAMERLDDCFQLELSDVMVCGLLELTVNVMNFRKICWH